MATGMSQQCQDVLDYMKEYGAITPLEALNELGCFRLAARIYDLQKEGYEIKHEMVKVPSGKRVAQYTLIV